MKTSIRIKDILRLSLPIYGGLFASTMVGIVDTAFLGKVSLTQQSAAGYGSLFYLVFLVIGMGFTLGTQILTARRIGEGKPHEVGKIFWNGIFFMLFYSTLIFILFNTHIHSFFDLITKSPEVSKITADYLRDRSFGIYGTMLNLCFMAFYVGKGKSTAISISSFTAAFVNIILDYIFIFGNYNFPRLEIKGAAIASGIAEISGTLVFVLYTVFQKDNRQLGILNSIKVNVKSLGIIFNVSLPLMLQSMISILSWFLFFTIIEKTGERNFGISIIIRSIYSIFMMGPISLGYATNSLVSNLIGQNKKDEVLSLIRKSVLVSASSMMFTVLPLVFLPKTIFLFFTTDISLAHESLSSIFSLVIALIIFSVSTVIFQAVSGTGKTKTALIIEITAIFIYLSYTFWASYYFANALYVIWIAEAVYMLAFGLISYFYMKSGKWKTAKI